MNPMIKTVPTVTAMAALAFLAACGSTPLPPAQPAAMAPVSAPTSAAAAASPAGTDAPATGVQSVTAQPAAPSAALPAHLDPANRIARERVIYFEFDSTLLDAADQALIASHARYLLSAPALTLKVEGHADERGGSEYNLALGLRRAETVRRALALLGVNDARVEATSWGEERPQAEGHEESAWTKNRRAEFVYPARR